MPQYQEPKKIKEFKMELQSWSSRTFLPSEKNATKIFVRSPQRVDKFENYVEMNFVGSSEGAFSFFIIM